MLSEKDGKKLINLARQTVEDYFSDKKLVLKKTEYNKKNGVFISIHTYPDHELRGCIGYPYPDFPLGEALQRASLSAAFQDPRFPPLTEEEFDTIVFEISVLTEPELIIVKNPKEYLKKIEIGRDGLIAENGFYKGILLPQVPLEFEPKWDVETFLEQTCVKSGLLPDMWLDSRTKIYKFQAQIFKEKKPGGEIIQT